MSKRFADFCSAAELFEGLLRESHKRRDID